MAGEIVYADLRRPGGGFSPAKKHHAPALCPPWHGVLLKASGLGHLVLLVVVVVLSVQACAGCKLCPQDWQLHGTRCYRLSKEKGNWTQGNKDCKNQEAQLMAFQDTEGKEYIKKITGGGTQRVWIEYVAPQKKWSLRSPGEMGEECWTLKDEALEEETCTGEYNWVCQKIPFKLFPSTAGDGKKCRPSV